MNQRDELDELYLKALKVEESGDHQAAFALFLQGAALGDAGAQNAVGLAYDSGQGVEKDKAEALRWFKKAHKTDGHTNYVGNIALTYAEMGKRRQAIQWWRKAVASGDGEAALELAKYLMKSEAVLSLLKMAVACKESLEITPAGKEEAGDLLHFLTRKSYN